METKTITLNITPNDQQIEAAQEKIERLHEEIKEAKTLADELASLLKELKTEVQL